MSERLNATIEHIRKQLADPDTQANPYPVDPLNHIICRFKNGFRRVPIEEVEYVRSSPSGVYVVCVDDNEYYTEMTLTALIQKTKLIKSHGSYLVNPDAVDTFEPLESGLARIPTRGNKKDAYVPVSRNYKSPVEIVLGIKSEKNKDE